MASTQSSTLEEAIKRATQSSTQGRQSNLSAQGSARGVKPGIRAFSEPFENDPESGIFLPKEAEYSLTDTLSYGAKMATVSYMYPGDTSGVTRSDTEISATISNVRARGRQRLDSAEGVCGVCAVES
jgi:hypothetical protein